MYEFFYEFMHVDVIEVNVSNNTKQTSYDAKLQGKLVSHVRFTLQIVFYKLKT